MDDADKAGIEIENYLAERINANAKPQKTLTPAGHCHTCYEDVEDNKLFCDRLCADQHGAAKRLTRSPA